MPTVRSRLIAVAALLSVAACSTVQFGRDFDPRQFETRVERGVSTRDAVRGWLGEPASRGIAMNDQGERLEEWTYYYGRGSLPNMQDARLKILQVRFDAAGRVSSYAWTGESGR
jgi:outer membrane protein assembly factor BamE (lipoprotein component of BamABCDE complex)